MAFDFPAAPADGTEFTPAGGPTYVFQTPIWLLKSDTASNITIADTAPAAPNHEDLWWESDSGTLFIFYDDGNSAQWVQAAGAAGGSAGASVAWGDITGKPATYPPDPHQHDHIENGTGVASISGTGLLTVTGGVTANQDFASSTDTAIVASGGTGTVAKSVRLRPNGLADPAGECFADAAGTFWSYEHMVVGSGNLFSGAGTSGLIITNTDPNPIYIRPLGATNITKYATIDTTGAIFGTGDFTSGSGFFIGTSGATVLAAGGPVYLRPGGPMVTAGQNVTQPTGIFQVTHTGAAKPGGGDWAVASDARIKNVLGDYSAGLDEIMALRPVRYVYKGNDTMLSPEIDPTGVLEPLDKASLTAPYEQSMNYQAATDATEFVGFVADEVEAIMPEMLFTTPGFIDGEATDIKNLNTTPLIYALLNAVKELKAEIDLLKGAA